jgi:hypothetical protein
MQMPAAQRRARHHACLTLLVAYIAQGRPDQPKPTACYEACSELVRDALVGQADPAESMRESFRHVPDAIDRDEADAI